MTKTVTGEKGKKETEAIRFMIHQRLTARVAAETLLDPSAAHLDEDAMCAFVEGRLEEAESLPMITHLVVCAPCRHTTAQLVRMESQFDPERESTIEEGPGRVRSLIDGLASRLTGSFEEETVFAYQSPEPDENAEPTSEEKAETPEDSD